MVSCSSPVGGEFFGDGHPVEIEKNNDGSDDNIENPSENLLAGEWRLNAADW